MGGPIKGLLAWLAFVIAYYALYIFTLKLDVPHFHELLNASIVGKPLNVPEGYKLALVATSPFNPLEDFVYPSVFLGYVLNFVFSVVLFSLYSLWAVTALRGSNSSASNFLKYSVGLPLLSSYIYVFSEFLLTGVVITGTSTFGVTTLFSPLISVTGRGTAGKVLWALTGLTSFGFILTVAWIIKTGSSEVPAFPVLFSMFVIFADIAYFTARAVINGRPLWRKGVALLIAFASSVLAYVFYLAPTPYGINVNHIGALLVLFTLGFTFARGTSNNFITSA